MGFSLSDVGNFVTGSLTMGQCDDGGCGSGHRGSGLEAEEYDQFLKPKPTASDMVKSYVQNLTNLSPQTKELILTSGAFILVFLLLDFVFKLI